MRNVYINLDCFQEKTVKDLILKAREMGGKAKQERGMYWRLDWTFESDEQGKKFYEELPKQDKFIGGK